MVMPLGFFSTLMSIWQMILNTFTSVMSTLGDLRFELEGVEYSVTAFLLGPGLAVYFTVVLGRWIKQTFFA